LFNIVSGDLCFGSIEQAVNSYIQCYNLIMQSDTKLKKVI